MRVLLYFAFFCSGISGLIFQVVWVRAFGNVFGNTIHSASLVVAIFMLGLGTGSYLAGVWADRRYRDRPESLLRTYAAVELAIAFLGVGVSVLVPQLGSLAALVSDYVREPSGWFVLSPASYAARGVIAVGLVGPIALLMGATLTLLIRHVIRADLRLGGQRLALLYAANTGGAALGCVLTDIALVPALGLQRTQFVAAGLNVLAAGVAWSVGAAATGAAPAVPGAAPRRKGARARQPAAALPREPVGATSSTLVLTSLALALSGCAALGMEILWFRHFSILLGAFRAVFSLLLGIILLGMGVGAFAGAMLLRRTVRAGELLAIVQALFVVSTLLGLGLADASSVEAAAAFDPVQRGAIGFAPAAADPGWARTWAELWFNARPILFEVLAPALLMGLAFPLGNALVQDAERAVGRRAGVLYLANTAGAVGGSIVAGFVLLPLLGMQASASVLMAVATLGIVPLALVVRQHPLGRPMPALGALAGCAAALAVWLALPSDHVNRRALGTQADRGRIVALSEGLTELIAVSEVPGSGRTLLTNGHAMSSTSIVSQRYMRALAHVPLLSTDHPRAVLVIGFGVGNTVHAASLHPSIERVEVADLSRGILRQASSFAEANHDVLSDARVHVYVNDGRHHLQMQAGPAYDLITLEPPPIAYAGVASLYSREFYALARSRLVPGGFVSQWLPAYQVPTETTLSMIKAFIDVFPQAVLLSGAEDDLVLLGAAAERMHIDPVAVAAALRAAPAVQRDLTRVSLGSVREIVGTFLGSSRTLADATLGREPVTDDRPLQEYGVLSALNLGEAVPASVVDLARLDAWCPTCFAEGAPRPEVAGLDQYMALLDLAYRATPADLARLRSLPQPRLVAGSPYLGTIVPESAELHTVLGLAHASGGDLPAAVEEFRTSLQLDPQSAATHWHLGAALAATGRRDEAIGLIRRSVELDPTNADAQRDLAVLTGAVRQ